MDRSQMLSGTQGLNCRRIPRPFIRKTNARLVVIRLCCDDSNMPSLVFILVYDQASRFLAENLRFVSGTAPNPHPVDDRWRGKWHNNCTHVRCSAHPLPFIQISSLLTLQVVSVQGLQGCRLVVLVLSHCHCTGKLGFKYMLKSYI